MRFKNRLLFLIYHLVTLLFILVVLNDYRVINLYKPQGKLISLSEYALNFINSTKYTQKPSSKNIQIVLTQDNDIGHFPAQGDDILDDIYDEIIKTSEGKFYIDPETQEKEFISYEEVKEEYCTTIHADASASRYGMVTAIHNLLNQANPPKLILLDYIFVGRSTHCKEYDQMLEDTIASHPEIIVIASTVKKKNQTNNLQNMDPSLYIHQAKKLKDVNLNSEFHDALIYPYFKDIYIKNPDLNNIGSGNILVEASLVTEGKISILTSNYKIPTVIKIIADRFKINITDNVVHINWRSDLYKHHAISNIIRPITGSDLVDADIVIFGSNLTGKSADKMYTPLLEEPTPGVYVHATMIDNVMNGDFVKRAHKSITVAIMVFFIFIVYISFFGIIVNMVPKDFFLSAFFRFDLIRSMHRLLSKKFATVSIFLIVEGVAILVAWIILYYFDLYIDMVSAVVVAAAMYSLMTFIHHFVMKVLVDKKSLLMEFEEEKYTMYFIKYEGDVNGVRKFHKDIKRSFDKTISIVEFFPFNNKDIFGFQTISKYYWWVSRKQVPEEGFKMDTIVHRVKCVSDFDAMSKEMRTKMATFWS